MPKKKNNLKILGIILGIVIIGAIVFKVLSGSSTGTTRPSQTGLITSSSTGQPVTAGVIAADGLSPVAAQSNELVVLLKSVSNLTLPNAVFTNPMFGVLQDISSRVRVEGDPGRTNPFLPIGQDQFVVPVDTLTPQFDSGINIPSSDPNALQTFLDSGTAQ